MSWQHIIFYPKYDQTPASIRVSVINPATRLRSSNTSLVQSQMLSHEHLNFLGLHLVEYVLAKFKI